MALRKQTEVNTSGALYTKHVVSFEHILVSVSHFNISRNKFQTVRFKCCHISLMVKRGILDCTGQKLDHTLQTANRPGKAPGL